VVDVRWYSSVHEPVIARGRERKHYKQIIGSRVEQVKQQASGRVDLVEQVKQQASGRVDFYRLAV